MVVFLDEKSKIGVVILKKLKEKQRTQKWLAENTGYSQMYIYKVINGKIKNPSFDFVCKLSEALYIPLSELSDAIKEGNKESG